jgi:hypothetical protein
VPSTLFAVLPTLAAIMIVSMIANLMALHVVLAAQTRFAFTTHAFLALVTKPLFALVAKTQIAVAVGTMIFVVRAANVLRAVMLAAMVIGTRAGRHRA